MAARQKSAHTQVSSGRRRVFLDALARHGVFTWAAREASPHATERHGAAASFRDLMKRDPDFSAQVALALEEADANVEHEAHRRAVEGYERPIYQQGELVGTERVFSDRLLEVMLRARIERYKDRKELTVSGSIDHRMVGVVLTPNDLKSLSFEQRNALGSILETISASRAEEQPLPVFRVGTR